jgi:CHASE3 domain sensor protein
MERHIRAPAAMIADADAITRAVEDIIGGRLKVVQAETAVARTIAVILIAGLVIGLVIHAVIVAAR